DRIDCYFNSAIRCGMDRVHHPLDGLDAFQTDRVVSAVAEGDVQIVGSPVGADAGAAVEVAECRLGSQHEAAAQRGQVDAEGEFPGDGRDQAELAGGKGGVGQAALVEVDLERLGQKVRERMRNKG